MTEPSTPFEIRLNEDGTLDEVVGTGQFHLEQMSPKHWWMALEYGSGRVCVNFNSKTKIRAFAENEPDSPPDGKERTGWPPGLLQDDCRGLARWFASKPDARRRVREALAALDGAKPEPDRNS